MLFWSWSAHISHFLSTDLEFSAQSSFLFCLSVIKYIPLWFFPSFARYELAYFRTLTLFRIAHYMQKSDCITSEDLAAPSTDPQRPTGITSWDILFQPKFSGTLLIFYWRLSELKMQIEHTHTHTPMTQQLRETSAAVYIHSKLACFASCRTVCFGTLKYS